MAGSKNATDMAKPGPVAKPAQVLNDDRLDRIAGAARPSSGRPIIIVGG